MNDFFTILALIYLTLSLPLAVYAVWCIYSINDEVNALKSEIARLDEDINILWTDPDDPDDGEDNQEVKFSNVIAFGKNLKNDS